MNNNNKYITIQSFMVDQLKLSGNKLLLYALIYGFSQDNTSGFRGSLSYISKWLNISKPTIIKLINELIKDALINKLDQKGGQGENVYIALAIKENGPPKETASKETLLEVVKKLDTPSKEIGLVGSKETLHNIYNSNNNIYIDIYSAYIEKIKKVCFSFNYKYNKKELAIERIEKLYKTLYKKHKEKTEHIIYNAINYYIIEQKDNIKKNYYKMPQYFFGPIERGSKVLYCISYINKAIEKEKEQKERKNGAKKKENALNF